MVNLTYKKIDIREKENLKKLIKTVLDNLERKDFFIPIPDEELVIMLNDNTVLTYGAYDNDKLIGTAQLCLKGDFIEKIKGMLNLNSNKVFKLGRYMVLQDYRNKNIMKNLEKELIKKAKELNCEYIIFITHPDNIASNKVIKFTGAKNMITTNIDSYLRSIYLLDLTK